MKLSESLAAVGPSFPYYPKLCPVVGGVKACIFLCVVFWKAFEEHDGWLQMSMADITKLSGLSAKEQRAARSALKALGVLQEREDRLAHLMFYRIDTEALDAAFDKPGSPEVPKGNSGECPKVTPSKGTRPGKDLRERAAAEIYEAYPRKVGRPVAIRAILKAFLKAEPDDLLAAVRNMAAQWQGEPLDFMPHPATWFNQERYNDPPETWGPRRERASAPRRSAAPASRLRVIGAEEQREIDEIIAKAASGGNPFAAATV